jgi:hypothetical protein
MPSFLWGPATWFDFTATTGLTVAALNSNAAQSSGIVSVATLLRVRRAGTLDRIEFYVPTVGGTGNTYEVVILTTSGGLPTASAYGGSAAQSVALTTTGYKTVTLTTPATAVRGDLVAVMLRCVSGTDYSTNNVTINSHIVRGNAGAINIPYVVTNTAGTSARAGVVPLLAARYSDGKYDVAVPHSGATPILSVAYNVSTTPDEIGLKFQVPFQAVCTGFYGPVDTGVIGSLAFDVVLYDNASSVIASVSVAASELGTVNMGMLILPWTTIAGAESAVVDGVNTVTLNPSVDYRLAIKPTTTDNMRLYQWVAANADAKTALVGSNLMQMTERTNAGAWTDTATSLISLGLLFEDPMTTDPTVTINPAAIKIFSVLD